MRRVCTFVVLALAAALMTVGSPAQAAGPGVISGTVTADSVELPGITVTYYKLFATDDADVWLPQGTAETVADGTYRLDVAAGTYRLGFSSPNDEYLPEFWDDEASLDDADNLVVDANELTADAQLVQGGWVEGRVTAGGEALPGITVELLKQSGADWQAVATTATDGDGAYSVSAPVGTYRVHFVDGSELYSDEYFDDVVAASAAEDVEIEVSGQHVTGRDADLQQRGIVSGVVRSFATQAKLEGIQARLFQATGVPADPWALVKQTQTDGLGIYSLSVRPGTYRVVFEDPTQVYEPDVHDGVTVSSGGTTTQHGSMKRYGSVSGFVTETGTDSGIEGIKVTLYSNPGSGWTEVSSTHTDGEGLYELRVRSGTYRLGFFDESSVYKTEFYTDAPSLATATDIVVEAEVDDTIDAVLDPRPLEAVEPPTIEGNPRVGVELVAQPGAWSQVPDSLSYQWRVNDQDVPGATGPTFTPGAAAEGELVGLQVIATAAGYDDGEAFATAVGPVVAGVAPQVVHGPVVTGTPRLGSILAVTVPTWDLTGVATSYQWKADGLPIAGATSSTLKPAAAQVGRRISVTATGHKPGHTPATATSSQTGAVSVVPTVKVKASDRNRVVRLVITVKAAGVKTVTGKVKVLRKKKVLKTVRLVGGKVTVRLKRQPKGKQRYTARYLGAAPVLPASKAVKVAV